MIESGTEVATSVELLVSQAADEFAEALAHGDRPTVDEFAARYPNIAKLLRQVLPTVEAMANLSAEGEVEGAASPRSLGDFLIEREIGRGGMGVVYAARQISLGRTVALKILPLAGVLEEKQLQRFKNEARAAATLEHPHIVPVYSVGCERGVHYFAMRYIDGQSLAEILRAIPGYQAVGTEATATPSQQASPLVNSLANCFRDSATSNKDARPDPPSPAPDTRPELQALISTDADFQSPAYLKNVARLGIQAAEALAYAHEQGVLHRDIKPGNLLLDVQGDLWIADFGLARLEQDAGITITGDMLGTLRYMSPEQASGQRLLDERSDVYSLGITLYEMLVLRPAFSGRNRQEVLRRIAVEDPKPPRQINRRIPPDLETIVLKAISKEPAGRYQSAQPLADDLRRYLDNQPIQARRPKLMEKCVKWSRRHPAAVWATILVLLTTTLVSAVSTLLVINAYNGEAVARQRAEEKEGQAKASEQDAEEASSFLAGILSNADKVRDGRAVTVVEVLDRSAKDLQSKFADNPVIRADLLEAVGNAYAGLRLFDKALPLYEQVRDLRTAALSRNDFKSLHAAEHVAQAYEQTGRVDAAIALQEETIRLAKANLGSDDRITLSTMSDLAVSYGAASRIDDAIRLDEEVLKLRKAKLGPEDRETLSSMGNLAAHYESAGRIDDAIRLGKEVLKLRKDKLGLEDRDTLQSMNNLAKFYYDAGRNAQALPLFEEVLKLRKANLGPDHPETLQAMSNLAANYEPAGRIDDAIRLTEEAIQLQQAKLGPDHPDTLNSMIELAYLYGKAGRSDEAIQLNEELLKLRKAKLGPNHRDTLNSMNNLAGWYSKVGRIDEAIRLAEDAVRLQTAKLGPDHPDTIEFIDTLGSAYGRKAEDLMHQGKTDEAVAEFVRALDRVKDGSSDESARKTLCCQLARNNEMFDQVAKLRPLETTLWIGHGQNHAVRSEWAEAVADFAKIIDRRPVGDQSFSEYAGLLLIQDDKQGYRQFCKKLVKLSVESQDPWYLYFLSRACVMGPTDAVEGSRLVQWAAQAAKEIKAPYVLHNLGLAYFRAGQFDATIESIQKSNSAGWGGTAWESLNSLVLAMVHYRLNHTEDARRYLKQAQDMIELAKPSATTDARIGCPDWIEANVLLREAESLLKFDTSNPKSETPMPHS